MKPEELTNELTLEEKLVLVVEEAGEVIQAVTKCLRFGYDRTQPGYGKNCSVLASEIGDLLGMIDALPLDHQLVEYNRKRKLGKAVAVKKHVLGDQEIYK